jgi:hypothetical protein
MERLKYIIDNYKNFVIFSDGNSHKDIAKGFYFKPLSAGFCTIDIGYKTEEDGWEKRVINIHCFGESISLGLKSKEEDEKIINSLIQH